MRYSMPVLVSAMALALGVAAPTLGQVINEDLKLLADDGAAMDRFGISIAINNGVVAVGVPYDDDNGTDSGSAYLFDAVTGAPIAKLLPSDGREYNGFGTSIAIDNGVVAVGAYYWPSQGSSPGSAYLFDASTGAQIAKLIPSDGFDGDAFGTFIAIDNGIVAVGASHDDDNGFESGSAYLFDASTGAQIAKLLPSDGAAYEEFGISIAIDNGIVAVGASHDDDNGLESGSAYLFDVSTGAQIAKLLPSDGTANAYFGSSIAIENGVVAAGARNDRGNGSSYGSAYLFDAATGEQIAKLLPADGTAEAFGCSVAIENEVVAVGARYSDGNGGGSGSAYLIDVSTRTQIAHLLPSDGAASDSFGHSIAIDNGVVAVGAYRNDDSGTDSGSAYVFDVGSIEPPCLGLFIDNLVTSETATFTVTNGTPGEKAIVVYGRSPGETTIFELEGYCATFGIDRLDSTQVIGGFNNTFDANGEITFEVAIPRRSARTRVLFQAAQHGTCPEECMSTLIDTKIMRRY